MQIVLSNAHSPTDLEQLVELARRLGVERVEWAVNPARVAALLSPDRGERRLAQVRAELETAGVGIHGLCIEPDPSSSAQMVFAKQCVDLLRALGGSVLRMVLRPAGAPDEVAAFWRAAAYFLDSTGRYAAYAAGGGGQGQTTVRLAYDVAEMGFAARVQLHASIPRSVVGLGLTLEETPDPILYRQLVNEINGFELTLNAAAVGTKHSAERINAFCREVTRAYDGPLVVEIGTADETRLRELARLAEPHAFDETLIDRTKSSYPSSVARLFRSHGTARLRPETDVVAGTVGTWAYTFQVEAVIATGGGFKFMLHHSTNWQAFQVDRPAEDGYVGVQIDAGAEIEKRIMHEDACLVVQLLVRRGQLRPGDEIRLVIGDPSGGAWGSRAQSFRQRDFRFYAMVDATGHGHYFMHPDPPAVRILAGPAARLKVVAPSVVYAGDAIEIGVRLEDEYHNEAAGTAVHPLRVWLGERELAPPEVSVLNGNPSTLRLTGLHVDAPGVHVLKVEDAAAGLVGASNAILCTADRREDKVFWGDIHGHTSLMDSVGTVDEYYTFGRDVAFLDFCCLSEHMDSYAGGRQASNDTQWEALKRGVKRYHQPGRFVTLLGYESAENSDANLYFSTDEAPWHVDGSYANLFAFARRHGAMVIPHMTSYPQRLRGYDWMNFDPEVVPVIEINSTHGASEYFGGERPLMDCEPGGFALDALNLGHKIGFIGSGDGHDCMPGNAPWGTYMNGLVAVFAPELTREAVLEAIRKRRCYAATNERILGYMTVAGAFMGEEIQVAAGGPLPIAIRFYGASEIDSVQVIKDGRVLETWREGGKVCEWALTDASPAEGDHYYYARMKQKDGEMAWLSPVFVHVARPADQGVR